MKRVVITGATGMIGLALIRQCLEHDCEVYAVVRPDSKRRGLLPDSRLLHIVECDLTDLEDLPELIHSDCDAFYHLGWSHTGKRKSKGNCYQINNIAYTNDAVHAAKALGCRIFVGAGSQAEYGKIDSGKIGPDTPVNPQIPYGICKYAAGKLAALGCDQLDMICVWIRIFSVYGFNDKKETLINTLIEKMHKNEHISVTEGVQQWDYLYCDDAARAFYLAGEKCNRSAVYCLGSGQSRKLKEYVETVAKLLDYDQPIGYGEIQYTSKSIMNLCADITKLKNDTGFTPQYSFEKGIKLYVESVLTNCGS